MVQMKRFVIMLIEKISSQKLKNMVYYYYMKKLKILF